MFPLVDGEIVKNLQALTKAVLLVAFVAGISAFGVAGPISVSVGSLYSVHPGESMELRFVVHNERAPSQVSFSASAPASLEATLKRDSFYSVSQDSENYLVVRARGDATPGDHAITLRASSNGEHAEKVITLRVLNPATTTSRFVSLSVSPFTCATIVNGDSYTFAVELDVLNAHGDYTIEPLGLAQGMNYEFSPGNTFYALGNGERIKTNFVLQTSPSTPLGQKSVVLRAVNTSNGVVAAQAPACVNVTKTTGILASISPSEAKMNAGETQDFVLSIQNTGSTDGEFFLSSDNEFAVLEKTQTKIHSGKVREVRLKASIPKNVLVGNQLVKVTIKIKNLTETLLLPIQVVQEPVTIETEKDLSKDEEFAAAIETKALFSNNTREGFELVNATLVVPAGWGYKVSPSRFAFPSGKQQEVSIQLRPDSDVVEETTIQAVLTAAGENKTEREIARIPIAIGRHSRQTALLSLGVLNPLHGLLVLTALILAVYFYAHTKGKSVREEVAKRLVASKASAAEAQAMAGEVEGERGKWARLHGENVKFSGGSTGAQVLKLESAQPARQPSA